MLDVRPEFVPIERSAKFSVVTLNALPLADRAHFDEDVFARFGASAEANVFAARTVTAFAADALQVL